jgi:hypothetical protein
MVLQIAFKITTPSETLSANPASKELMGCPRVESRDTHSSMTVSLLGRRVWRLQDGGCGSSKCLPEPKDPAAPSLYGSSTTRVANHGHQTLRRVCLFYPAFCTHLIRKTHCGVFFLFFGLSVCRPIFLSLAVSRISRHCNSWGFKRVKKEQGSMGRA